ncbi:hypothetical protein K9M79_04100 [Candidatus Woesearchaeota archaeon]|nr:hypothetical protein [Candidatus Woesearchaeota archaeon]
MPITSRDSILVRTIFVSLALMVLVIYYFINYGFTFSTSGNQFVLAAIILGAMIAVLFSGYRLVSAEN